MPRRCLHGVHPSISIAASKCITLCLGAACTGCIIPAYLSGRVPEPLPRRCLHGVHHGAYRLAYRRHALPRRCLHGVHQHRAGGLTDGAPLPRRCLHGVHRHAAVRHRRRGPLPRRCLHGVHRQKPTNCGTPFCSIRRESVDSFSEINNKDSCADYFPALFCCQGDLHHHYRQPRTDNRPVLRCEQHRLFLFILSSHYRRLL